MIRHQTWVPLLTLLALLLVLLYFSNQFSGLGETAHQRAFDRGREMPEFSLVRDVQQRKIQFFTFLLPMVQEENRRLQDIRQRLQYIQDHQRHDQDLDAQDRAWLGRIQHKYDLQDAEIQSQGFWDEMLKKVDLIPESLVLVQAANESAWGTSRFAREGNNLFGQWCFRPGCGMVPEGRPAGETYEVARFNSVTASVRAYMHNLNTGFAYEELREIRAQRRLKGLNVQAADLAVGLIRYSQRGEEYVRELLAMIRVNTPIIDKLRSDGSERPEA